jgi:hypothetical protein
MPTREEMQLRSLLSKQEKARINNFTSLMTEKNAKVVINYGIKCIHINTTNVDKSAEHTYNISLSEVLKSNLSCDALVEIYTDHIDNIWKGKSSLIIRR